MKNSDRNMIKQIIILFAYGFNIAFPEYAVGYLTVIAIHLLFKNINTDYFKQDDTDMILLFAGVLGCVISLIKYIRGII